MERFRLSVKAPEAPYTIYYLVHQNYFCKKIYTALKLSHTLQKLDVDDRNLSAVILMQQ